jgi:hypothetical protein
MSWQGERRTPGKTTIKQRDKAVSLTPPARYFFWCTALNP